MSSTTRPVRAGSTAAGRADDLSTLRPHLVRAAAARRTQLAGLRPVKAGDAVAAEHHASVRRILDEIHAALDRMDAGTYGDCTRCVRPLPLGRLVDRPWVARCERCSSRTL